MFIYLKNKILQMYMFLHTNILNCFCPNIFIDQKQFNTTAPIPKISNPAPPHLQQSVPSKQENFTFLMSIYFFKK